MKIGVISDTHGGLDSTLVALNYLTNCDYIIHCGDVLYHGPRNDLPKDYNPRILAEILSEMDNIYYVRGNCDSDVDEMVTKQDIGQKSRLLTLGEKKIYVVHGYEETEEERIQKAMEVGADILISGHSHVKVLRKESGLIILNPGSTTIPKDGVKSLALIEGYGVALINLETLKPIEKISF